MREKPSFYVALTPIIFMMIVLVVGIGVMVACQRLFINFSGVFLHYCNG